MVETIRRAVRGFRRRRGVAVAVVATLAMGIGANAAIFSMVDGVLLRPLPYPAADRLVAVYELNRGLKQATQLVAPVRLDDWNRGNHSFAGLAGSYFENMTDTSGAEPQRVEAMRVSPRFFAVIGVSAAIGRTPVPEEEVFGGAPSIVVSDGFWRARFRGDPSIVGRSIVLNGVNRTIVGVMPPSFRYPTATTEAWVPAQMSAGLLRERRARFYTAIGRLEPDVTIHQAEADLATIQARLGEQFPETDKGWGALLVPLQDDQIGSVGPSLWLLFAAVALLLLAACGNVACLMLADAARRQREVAIRLALGGSRTAVVGQLLTEAFLLAITGAALGLILARWGVEVLRHAATELPLVERVAVDARVVLFTFLVAATTTIIFALAPAIAASGADPPQALTRGGRGHSDGPGFLQRLLVAAQVALAIVLLTGAGLLVRSFVRIQQVSLGFDPANVITFRMSASWSESRDAVVTRQARTIARLEAIPGVEAAAISQATPAGVDFPPGEFTIVGGDLARKLFAHGRSVSSGYFRTLHIPILDGKTCSGDPAAPLFSNALVTRSFADQFFPGSNPIGHALSAPGFPSGTTVEIAGVAGDVRENGAMRAAEPLIYWCGYSPYWPDPHFLVRFDPSRPVSIAAIRTALAEIEPRRALYGAQLLGDMLSASVSRQRLSAILLAVFAATTLLLACLGLSGVLSQLVTARRREIGVRLALGARPAQVVGSVAGQAAVIAGIGIAAGVAAALALAHFMTTMVFGIAPHDPLTFALVPVVLAVVAAVSALVPARRAASIEPMSALRED